jgi:hypothetical protein
MATFAELFSVELPDDSAEDSISFEPALFGKEIDNPRRSIVHHSIHGKFSIRESDWKLLLASGSGGWSAPKDKQASQNGLPEMQLYNVVDDPGETTNVVEHQPEKAEQLIELLKEIVQRGRSTAGADQANDVKVDIWKTATNK